MIDPIAAVVSFLAERFPDSNVYGDEIPSGDVTSMPRSAIVVRYAGGAASSGYQALLRGRLDVICYAKSPRSADLLWTSVHIALKDLRRQVIGETLLHWLNPAGGPIPRRDPDVQWASVFSAWQYLISETAVV